MKKPIIYLERQRGLGDVLWVEPLIRQLAGKYRRVVVLSGYNVLFQNYPLSQVVFKNRLNWFEKWLYRIDQKLQHPRFFIRLDMAYENHPKMHFLHAYQQNAALPFTEEYPKLYLNEDELTDHKDLQKPFAVLHLDTWSEKNYRQVFGIDWTVIAEFLKNKNIEVIQIGKAALNIRGTTYRQVDTRQMISLIKKSILFIGIDSGPSHLAASLSTPAIIFFGAIDPDFRHFKKLFNGYILQQPCIYAGCYHEVISVRGPVCPIAGDVGVPPCCIHTHDSIIRRIDLLIQQRKAL